MAGRYPTSWSVGKVLSGEACPKQYEGKYVLRLPEKKSPAAARGDAIHAKADRYLSGKISQMPAELRKMGTHYRNLRKLAPMTEQRIAVNDRWRLTHWRKGWLRCILDALHVEPPLATIVDHKTGRIYPSHSAQAEIYACVVADLDEKIERLEVKFYYTDRGVARPWLFTRQRVMTLRESWTERAERVLAMRKFPATPSPKACQWCPRRSDRGGDCSEWRRVR